MEYWVYCTFVELKFENFIYKKSTDNEKNPAKLGIGETTKIMLIKYTGASVVTGVYGEGTLLFWEISCIGHPEFICRGDAPNNPQSVWVSLSEGFGNPYEKLEVAENRDRMIEIFMNRVCFLGIVTIP